MIALHVQRLVKGPPGGGKVAEMVVRHPEPEESIGRFSFFESPFENVDGFLIIPLLQGQQSQVLVVHTERPIAGFLPPLFCTCSHVFLPKRNWMRAQNLQRELICRKPKFSNTP